VNAFRKEGIFFIQQMKEIDKLGFALKEFAGLSPEEFQKSESFWKEKHFG
jgi:hypothetical protein